ncbi:hypothetical protein GUJ93_ZPchr0015g6827 [Zizania palustris]|uniref:Uncharacterized protein n=1 Tax=Zizania palustris TaxID=103762 RepID=A0A8J5W6Z6_ZIZPA|nr:hypothetical protein GUJ93_ZPchr0015g6827 [Zizania palustris]
MASDPSNPSCSPTESFNVAGCSGDAGGKDRAVVVVDATEQSGNRGGGVVVAGAEAESAQEKVPQPGVLPLLGKPYFTCIMCKSHVQPPFHVSVSIAVFLLPEQAGGAEVVGVVPSAQDDTDDTELARLVVGDAVHRQADDPAAGGRVVGLRVRPSSMANSKMTVAMTATTIAPSPQPRQWRRDIQGSSQPPRFRCLGKLSNNGLLVQ